MIGDRFLTDVVFGNRNGMLTIRPAPFTSRGEPKAVLAVSQPGAGGAGPGLGCARAVQGLGWAVQGLELEVGCAGQGRWRGGVCPVAPVLCLVVPITADCFAAASRGWTCIGSHSFLMLCLVCCLSVFCAPLQARYVEEGFVGRWQRAGVQPPQHPLVADAAAASAFLRHPDTWESAKA
jgi:hypothetical protein